MIHTVRQWLFRNRNASNKVVVTLDLENASNSVDRSVFLASIRRIAPGLAPWVDFGYKSPSHLFLGGRLREGLESSRGIQQGDPLGPLLFALAIHEAIFRAKASAEAAFP